MKPEWARRIRDIAIRAVSRSSLNRSDHVKGNAIKTAIYWMVGLGLKNLNRTDP